MNNNVKLGDKIEIISAGEFNAYEVGDVMTVSEILNYKIIATDCHDEEHALWDDEYTVIERNDEKLDSIDSLFDELDKKLKELGGSDSSIEYAPHINKHFVASIEILNKIKDELEIELKDIDYYYL